MQEADIKAILEAKFPNLTQAGYALTSEADPRYNCIAWAADDKAFWWEPVKSPGFYWPPGASMSSTLQAYIEAYSLQGYQPCSDPGLEQGFEKIAIFIKNSFPSHAAKQLESGAWSSKLGKFVDIRHNLLSGVEGDEYGKVAQIMKRSTRSGA